MKRFVLYTLLCMSLNNTVMELAITERTPDTFQINGSNLRTNVPVYGAAVFEGGHALVSLWEYDKMYHIRLDRDNLTGTVRGAINGAAAVHACE